MNRSFLWLAALLPLSAFPLNSGIAAENNESPGERVFGVAKVVQFHLTMSEMQFAALAPAGGAQFGPRGFGPPREQQEGTHRNMFGVDFPWAAGDLTFDGETFKEVGVRYKGNYTFMATAQSLKKSMKLDLNKHVDGQKLDGLTMLNLHCGVSVPFIARKGSRAPSIWPIWDLCCCNGVTLIPLCMPEAEVFGSAGCGKSARPVGGGGGRRSTAPSLLDRAAGDCESPRHQEDCRHVTRNESRRAAARRSQL